MDYTACLEDVPQIEFWFTPDFTADELTARREGIAAAIGERAYFLIASAPPTPHRIHIQDANFYYYSGLETCHSYLLVEGASGMSTVFMPSRDTMDGDESSRLGFEDDDLICRKVGVDRVLPSSELTAELGKTELIFTPHAEVEAAGASRFAAMGCARKREEEEWDMAEPRHKRFIRLIKERLPNVRIEDAVPLICNQRSIKSPAEIEVLRKAGSMSAKAVVEAMKKTTPGVNEGQLQAIAENVFREDGRSGVAYSTIVAGAQRTWDGHYSRNSMTLNEGEIVLMDCAPDFRHYASDIARIWPIGGAYSPWHRTVYGFITEYHKTLLSLVRPGVMVTDIYKKAAKRMADLCEDTSGTYRDMKPILAQMVEKGVNYFNHAVGMSAHDAVGPWRDEPLREGAVCVCDPMVWCEPQHEYIRVEDTLVVTADGCERLTGSAPIELDEIEALVGSGTHS